MERSEEKEPLHGNAFTCVHLRAINYNMAHININREVNERKKKEINLFYWGGGIGEEKMRFFFFFFLAKKGIIKSIMIQFSVINLSILFM